VDEITRDKGPITVKLSTPMMVAIVAFIGGVSGAVVWLKMIDAAVLENARRIGQLAPLEQRLDRLEWRLELLERRPATSPSPASTAAMPSLSERSLHALEQTR
jgi:hypothetical protein